jgi:ComF family protein
MLTAAIRGLRRSGTAALDVLLPPQCLKCRAAVDRQGLLCPACWGEATWLAPPLCAACGFPFEYEEGPGALCAACTRARTLFERARAALVYDDASKPLILSFKHADRLEGAPAYGRWLARAGAELVRDAELIAPVPLHRWRLLRRRYNQAALLALALGRIVGKPCVPDLLARVKPTRSQGGLGRAGRAENVRAAFAVRPKRRDAMQGKRVLLVDDVYTTGATATACARALLRAGAGAVDVLTLARVVRPAA